MQQEAKIRKSVFSATLAATVLSAATAAAAQPAACPAGQANFKIYYDLGLGVVSKEGYPIMQYAWNRAQPGGHIYVDGNSDGSEPVALALARAKGVGDLFTGAGVPAGRLTVSSSGASRPAVPVAGPEPLNRRVEICIAPG